MLTCIVCVLVRLCNLGQPSGLQPLHAMRVGYTAKETGLHSLSGLDHLYIDEVPKSPVRDLLGGF